MTCLLTQPLILFFEDVPCVHKVGTKQSIVDNIAWFDDRSLIRAILEGVVIQMEGGNLADQKMTSKPHSGTTESRLHSLDLLHICRRSCFLVNCLCFSFKHCVVVMSTQMIAWRTTAASTLLPGNNSDCNKSSKSVSHVHYQSNSTRYN